jgi:hypothetical protein
MSKSKRCQGHKALHHIQPTDIVNLSSILAPAPAIGLVLQQYN